MTAIQVAVYYVPEGQFSNQLTSIVGWDIRAEKMVGERSLPYGAHLIIISVFSALESDLPEIVDRVALA